MTNYEELNRLAEAAREDCEPDEVNWYLLEDLKAGFVVRPPDFEFVAAASPDVILGLLADLERKDALLRLIADNSTPGDWPNGIMGALEKELSK